ncbi:DUF4245 domain-containing protein [Frigoribacterium sp. ACAM 257]|uniref:DUF4245 domain-containing protein n=1 Tax=Frigoribacterium sp. ACAM 257 TaxID=2508998 RepID=UPI0011B9656A|nr:DUF4245 domain-containing protein [Frigoribacterium sp. ACAM 257]TWX37123.1 DUF4245 domain-containing protein [Frigoribacterium sp. ACAM 257]
MTEPGTPEPRGARGSRSREPRIVAELGRPETPDETARRKAENTRKHYANQTAVNLTLSIVASLAVVLFLVLVVVRPGGTVNREEIDYRSVAQNAESNVDVPLAAPDLPSGWTSNRADISTGTADGVATWYVGLITPTEQFIALEQGVDANATWVANAVQARPATGATTIAGLDWQVYDRRDGESPGNFAYSMTTTVDRSSYVLHGTAGDVEFEQLATALAEQLADQTGDQS